LTCCLTAVLEQVQVGLALKDEVVPFAVKYYTGEANKQDDDDDDDAGEWEDVDDDDDGSAEDDDDAE
jgi:nucleosome assembly protein 1-like 1